MSYVFTSEKQKGLFGWRRTVKVGDQEYSLSVRQGRRVRIAFKPRGKNWGYEWHGTVHRIGTNHGLVWTGQVEGSIGCRGLLRAASVLGVTC